MSREIYVPIADAFFESSIMQEELPVRFVMLALIRLGLRPGANGVIDVDLRTFAGSINLPVADVERAIERLMQPDPRSASPDEDGRRIVPVDPSRPFRNWRLVNWGRYRKIVHRANDAARKREERSHAPEGTTDIRDASGNVRKRPVMSENGATNTNTNTNTRREESRSRVTAETAVPPTPPVTEFVFDVVGRGGSSTWAVPRDLFEELTSLYPNADIPHELAKAIAKIRTRAVHPKTRLGMPRFLHAWMERAQNAARPTGQTRNYGGDTAGAPVVSATPPNPLGLALSKDASSIRFSGLWYERHHDGKRWLANGNTRPDGTDLGAHPKDASLNEKVWKAMNELAGARTA